LNHRIYVSCLRVIHSVVSELVDLEVKSGLARSNVIIGGFSQGGAVSLYSGLTKGSLGGIIVLSAYLPFAQEFNSTQLSNIETPILMCHGTQDETVPHSLGKQSIGLLSGKNLTWKEYRMGHTADLDEMDDVIQWIQTNVNKSSKL
jgi:predicted esterase